MAVRRSRPVALQHLRDNLAHAHVELKPLSCTADYDADWSRPARLTKVGAGEILHQSDVSANRDGLACRRELDETPTVNRVLNGHVVSSVWVVT